MRSGSSSYYHADALGSSGALTSASEATTDKSVRDAFGTVVTASGSTPTPFGFVGQGGYRGDSDTGLLLCGYRYYDCSTGRFLSRDPAEAGYNWYSYCKNDPKNAIDPQGLDVQVWLKWGPDGPGDLHSEIVIQGTYDGREATITIQGGPDVTGPSGIGSWIIHGGYRPIVVSVDVTPGSYTPPSTTIQVINKPKANLTMDTILHLAAVVNNINNAQVPFDNTNGPNCHTVSNTILKDGFGFDIGPKFEQLFPGIYGGPEKYPIQGWGAPGLP